MTTFLSRIPSLHLRHVRRAFFDRLRDAVVSIRHRRAPGPTPHTPSLWRPTRLAGAILSALEPVGRARAASELRRLAHHLGSVDPRLARQMRDVSRRLAAADQTPLAGR